MKKVVLTCFLGFSLLGAEAWGPTGHRTTGWITARYLNTKAKKKIESILNSQSIAMASTWMDEVRSDRKYDHMEDWHWVTVPDGKSYVETEKNKSGDVIEAIQRVVSELKSGSLTEMEEAERVKVLIHLVGDIHQPLHVGRGDDKGGNDIKVKWFGKSSNLHRVWDSDMIDGTLLSYTELAESLRVPSKEEIAALQNATVLDWANESMKLREQVYDIGEGKLGYEYSYKNMDTVRRRLLEAGIRLAGILNEIYG